MAEVKGVDAQGQTARKRARENQPRKIPDASRRRLRRRQKPDFGDSVEIAINESAKTG